MNLCKLKEFEPCIHTLKEQQMNDEGMILCGDCDINNMENI